MRRRRGSSSGSSSSSGSLDALSFGSSTSSLPSMLLMPRPLLLLVLGTMVLVMSGVSITEAFAGGWSRSAWNFRSSSSSSSRCFGSTDAVAYSICNDDSRLFYGATSPIDVKTRAELSTRHITIEGSLEDVFENVSKDITMKEEGRLPARKLCVEEQLDESRFMPFEDGRYNMS